MRISKALARRAVVAATALSAVAGTSYLSAFADAPDPLPPPTASMSGQTLTIEGNWSWPTHKNKDCNTDRWAAGYAVAWNDMNDQGNLVGTVAGLHAYVGTSTDNFVHWIHKAGDANPHGDPVGASRCGLYNAAKKYNSGHWGPISHTYPAAQTAFHVCVVTYDVHNGGGKTPGPDSKDLLAGGPNRADDNSIEKNQNTPLGNQCFDITIPKISTDVSSAAIQTGTTVTDTATITDYSNAGPPTGTVTFKVYSSLNMANANHCGTLVGTYGTNQVSLVGGHYQATSDPATLGVGTFYWLATYNGDDPSDPTKVHNAAISGKCDDSNETVTVTKSGTPAPRIVKSSVPASGSDVQRGDRIDYTIQVFNDGSADATGLTITDNLPDHVTVVGGTIDNGGTLDPLAGVNGVITWTPIDVPMADPVTNVPGEVDLHVSVTVDNDAPEPSDLVNVAHLGNQSSSTTHHVPEPVLGIVKTSDPPTGSIVQRGDRIDYTVALLNSGLAPGTDVTVTDTLPEHVTVVPGTIDNGGTESNGVITWTGLTVPAKSGVTLGELDLHYSVTVDMDATEGATLTNVAILGGQQSTTVHRVPSGDLTLVKTVDKDVAKYGDTLTYGFTAAATGKLNQTGVTVTDVVPDGLTYVDGSAECTDTPCTATYDDSTRTITWDLGNLNAGAERTLQFKATIDTPVPDANGGLPAATFINSGLIQSNETASTPSNEVKTSVVQVLGEKHIRHRPPVLPFTGLPSGLLGGAALMMVGVGIWMATVRRRRTG